MAIVVGTASLALPVGAQSTQPPDAPPQTSTLPAELRAALHQVEDFTPRFDFPAYYALVEHVRHSAQPPGFAEPALGIADWSVLLETPSSFRGQALTLEGTIGRNKGARSYPNHPHAGTVYRLELSHRDAPLSTTVICTEDVSDLPLGATIEVTGYFLATRRYTSADGRVRHAGLIVARGPTVVARPNPIHAKSKADWRWFAGFASAGLLIGWILLRSAVARRGPRDIHALRATHAAPSSLADDLAEWADSAEGRGADEH